MLIWIFKGYEDVIPQEGTFLLNPSIIVWDLTVAVFVKSRGVRFTTLNPRAKIGSVEPTQYLRDSERMTLSGKALGVAW